MAKNTMVKNIKAARERVDETFKKATDAARIEVLNLLREVLPPGISLQWRQYTPYFNDGEACEFGVEDPTLFRTVYQGKKRKSVEYGAEDAIEDASYASGSSISDLTNEQLGAFQRAWDALATGEAGTLLMLRAFGDHVEVVVTSDSVNIDDYDHE